MSRRVLSILEFLRTGKLGGITCGCTTTDVIAALGQPNYEDASDHIKNSSVMGFADLEVWFHAQTQIVNRLSIKGFRNLTKPKSQHTFAQAIPHITRAKVDPWVLRHGLGIDTMKRFLKTANLEYQQSRQNHILDRLDLESGVCLLFDPIGSDDAGLGYLGISNTELIDELYSESVQNQVNSGRTS